MGIVKAGFVTPHHIDAVPHLGYVDIVGVAGSSQASADKKAEAVGARRAYGSYEALLDDPEIQVIHNATPNCLHDPVKCRRDREGEARHLRHRANVIGRGDSRERCEGQRVDEGELLGPPEGGRYGSRDEQRWRPNRSNRSS